MTWIFALLLWISPPDTLRLADLQREAIRSDARFSQLALQEQLSALRRANIRNVWRPQLSGAGSATYQSEVPQLPFSLPGGRLPEFSKDHYSAILNAEQTLYDGGATAAGLAAERAQMEVEEQAILVELDRLREAVNAAYMGVLLADAGTASLEILGENLDVRLRTLRARLQAGVALPSEVDALRVERLRVQQQEVELAARRASALERLALLTGRPLTADAVLVAPASVVPVPDKPDGRLEYGLFERRRESLALRSSMLRSRLLPQASAFVQGGFGRPGYDFFNDDLHGFWQGGLRLRWAPLDWGQTGRERQILAMQERLVDTQEAAFTDELARARAAALSDMDRLSSVIRLDDEIVALREAIARETAIRLERGTATASVYVEAENEAHRARLARDEHRIQLLQARVGLATLLGQELE